jgi:hypothetical protein
MLLRRRSDGNMVAGSMLRTKRPPQSNERHLTGKWLKFSVLRPLGSKYTVIMCPSGLRLDNIHCVPGSYPKVL